MPRLSVRKLQRDLNYSTGNHQEIRDRFINDSSFANQSAYRQSTLEQYLDRVQSRIPACRQQQAENEAVEVPESIVASLYNSILPLIITFLLRSIRNISIPNANNSNSFIFSFHCFFGELLLDQRLPLLAFGTANTIIISTFLILLCRRFFLLGFRSGCFFFHGSCSRNTLFKVLNHFSGQFQVFFLGDIECRRSHGRLNLLKGCRRRHDKCEYGNKLHGFGCRWL